MKNQPALAFIRLPPNEMVINEDNPNPLLLIRADMRGEELIDAICIEGRIDGFHETGNPVLMMEAFLLSLKMKVHPPAEVLQWVGTIFTDFHENQGKIGLDNVAGLSKRGKTPPFKALLMEQRNDTCFRHMDYLMDLGATREQAAALVAGRMESVDWNKTAHDMSDLSADSLIDMHSRRKRTSAPDEARNDPEWISSFLATFAGQDLPPAVLAHVVK